MNIGEGLDDLVKREPKVVHDTARNRRRDEFAMAALTGLISDRETIVRFGLLTGDDNGNGWSEFAARASYELADAMLKAREA